MRVCVIGLGYVGAVTSVCLARDGHEVLGIDLDEVKLDLLRAGRPPIVEEGIDNVARAAADSGRLEVAGAVDDRVGRCDLIFVCVGTPSEKNGSQDLTAVRRVSEEIGAALRSATNHFPVVVLRSTVPPGTTEDVVRPIIEEESGKRAGTYFGLCFQPEFLREGSSVKDFYRPPFTIVGSDSKRAIERVRELFGGLDCEFVETDFRAAEMLKLACNAFHALKVSFANEVGRLGRSLGVDSREVMALLCRDTNLNISPAYLRPGFAFGGSCLPKDLRAMLYLGKRADVDLPLLSGVAQTNNLHIQHAADLVMAASSRKVGMVGLSFKPGTDDLRESPLVTLAETLIGKGFDLRIFDPAVNIARLIGSNKRYIDSAIPHIELLLTNDLATVFQHADVLVIGQKQSGIQELLSRYPMRSVVDLVGIEELRGVENYTGVCWR